MICGEIGADRSVGKGEQCTAGFDSGIPFATGCSREIGVLADRFTARTEQRRVRRRSIEAFVHCRDA